MHEVDLEPQQAAQDRIEFPPLAELEFPDDLAGEVAREHELYLAGDGLRVHHGASFGEFFGLGAQKDVFSGFDQHPRLGFVQGRDQLRGGKGEASCRQGQADDPVLPAPQRPPERTDVELIHGLRNAKARSRHLRLHHLTPHSHPPAA